MTTMSLPCRYLSPDKNQWPQQLTLQDLPIPLGIYGQADPPNTEDLMFLFDQVTRLAPQSLNLQVKGQTSEMLKQTAVPPSDLFFYHYLSRYLNIPCTIFEIFFRPQPPLLISESTDLPLNPTSEKPEKFKRFSLYLEEKRQPPQEQVKQWIRELYLP